MVSPLLSRAPPIWASKWAAIFATRGLLVGLAGLGEVMGAPLFSHEAKRSWRGGGDALGARRAGGAGSGGENAPGGDDAAERSETGLPVAGPP